MKQIAVVVVVSFFLIFLSIHWINEFRFHWQSIVPYEEEGNNKMGKVLMNENSV